MNHRDFPRIRDTIALASMLQRGRDLETLCADLEHEYRGLRRMLLAATDRNEIDGLTFELYNQPSGEYGDLGGIAWQWASAVAAMEDILRDARYIEYAEQIKRAS